MTNTESSRIARIIQDKLEYLVEDAYIGHRETETEDTLTIDFTVLEELVLITIRRNDD